VKAEEEVEVEEERDEVVCLEFVASSHGAAA